MPKYGYVTEPFLISSSVTALTLFDGIAKNKPWIGCPCWSVEMPSVFTPITSPLKLTSGPPELPGLMAASCWIRLLYWLWL